jgi:hypothetical protein
MKLINIEELSERAVFNTGVFAALWGLAEISLGVLLHASKIPFRGAIMSILAITILVCARSIINYKGSLVLLGLVTATFRLLLGVGFNVTPFLAIIIESFIADLILSKIGYSWQTSLLTGGLIMLYSLIHGLIMQMIFLGVDIYKIYYQLLLKISNFIGISESSVLVIIILFPFIQIGLGIFAGSFGWSVGKNIQILMKAK